MPSVILSGLGDAEPIKLDSKYVQLSSVLKEAVEMQNSGGDEIPVALPNIPQKSLELVVDFLKHYTDEAKVTPKEELKDALLKKELDGWDAEFLSALSIDQLMELCCAANYLNLEHLQIVCAKKVATILKGASADEMRAAFKLTDEWEPEAYKNAKKEMDWLFGKEEKSKD